MFLTEKFTLLLKIGSLSCLLVCFCLEEVKNVLIWKLVAKLQEVYV